MRRQGSNDGIVWLQVYGGRVWSVLLNIVEHLGYRCRCQVCTIVMVIKRYKFCDGGETVGDGTTLWEMIQCVLLGNMHKIVAEVWQEARNGVLRSPDVLRTYCLHQAHARRLETRLEKIMGKDWDLGIVEPQFLNWLLEFNTPFERRAGWWVSRRLLCPHQPPQSNQAPTFCHLQRLLCLPQYMPLPLS